MIGVLMTRGNVDTDMHIERVPCEQGAGHLQAAEKGLDQTLPSQLSGGTKPVNTSISDVQSPEL